jgi:deoxyinosine 3'endonuclease (endonuclease V)
VVAADAFFSQVLAERTAVVPEVPPYQQGEFFRRELPPLRAVLAGIGGLGLLVVDGYADLDPGGRPGLGARAHAEFGIPVIGVAKSAFATATHAIPVLRGTSTRPVFCHRRRDFPHRRGGVGPPHGGPVPDTRRAAPRRRTRAHRITGGYSGDPSPPLVDARNAACASVSEQRRGPHTYGPDQARRVSGCLLLPAPWAMS